jgi:predicted ATP-binding protein involved in virulence
LHEGKPLSNDNELVKELEAKEKELEELTGKKSTKYTRMTELVGLAITTLLPDITEIKVDRSTGNQRILVKNFDNIVNISQLSQGQKSLLALSGDLALRLVTLNPDSKNALHSSGVVVIDEIELHLHPKWQQRIIMGLQKAFPNIQFIITTHSPQVLSTVDKSCIRQICFDEHSELTVTTPQFQTKGVTSADILARIMETNSTPENIEEATWLNDFSRCLKNDDQEALAVVFSKIREHYGASHPVVIDCESQIRIFEMKARLKKD